MEIIVIVFSPTYKSLFKQMIRDQAHFFKHGFKSRIKIYKSIIIPFSLGSYWNNVVDTCSRETIL